MFSEVVEMNFAMETVSPNKRPDLELSSESVLNLQGKTVLLVEDNIDSQEFMTRMLSSFGLVVRVASNGLEAITHVSMYEPDIVLMDLRMPVVDGFDATRRLRLDGFEGPIIAITAEPESTHRHECLDNGFNDFVVKPVVKRDLVTSIATHLQTAKKTIH
ncbi:MAG: response regulator [Proteobacteria bacterium]|nr:MAG: response regulator [Pseudomonadota bacterium]